MSRLLRLLLTAVLALTGIPGAPAAAGYASATLPDTTKIDPALLDRIAADRTSELPVIVEMAHATAPFAPAVNAQLAQRALDLLARFGRPVGGLALIDSAAGWAKADGIDALSAIGDVAFIHADSTIQPRKGKEPKSVWPPGHLAAPYPRVVNADAAWRDGATGKGVGVAILDSGIDPDLDLLQPVDRIVASVNFAGDRGPTADAGGHGTHVAGIVAGNGAKSDKEYVGIAPEANVIDVRVLNRNGSGRISSVVRGIEWVLAHRAAYNIRVLNMSFGAPARRSYRLDPLTAAVEIAWKRGLVVVAAAGNGGPNSGTVDTPGIDPYAITVGATDDQGTLTLGDDVLAWFSAWGTPPGSSAKPDLVAPGRRIVSLRAAGSALDVLFPERVVVAKNGSTYFRMTGTSMSTAVVSGAVALLLERYPGLTPDQVKAVLTGTTQPYGNPPSDARAHGSGLLDVRAAIRSDIRSAADRGLRPADAFARSLYPVLYGQPVLYVDGTSVAWGSVAWDRVVWDSIAWDSVAWDSVAWDSVAWDSVAWDSVAWDSVAWDSVAWDSLTLD